MSILGKTEQQQFCAFAIDTNKRVAYSCQLYFEGHIDDEKYCGHLYGLGIQHVQNGNDGAANNVNNNNQSPPVGAAVVGQLPPAIAGNNATSGNNNGGQPVGNNSTVTSSTDGVDGAAAASDGGVTDNGHDAGSK